MILLISAKNKDKRTNVQITGDIAII